MKSFLFSPGYRRFMVVFVFVSVLILLVSFSPVKISDNIPATLSKVEMDKLVDNALKDSLFTSITEADVKRFLSTISKNQSINKQKWGELAKKKNLSIQETEYILSLLGFTNLGEFKSYADLLSSLGKKYEVDRMNKHDQKIFFDVLRKKQGDYITNNSVLEKVFKKTYSGVMPPECWKCVYDYRDCLTPGVIWVVSYTPVTTSESHYEFSSNGVRITHITFTTPSNAQITYINPYYSTATCEGVYRNCINNCATP